MTLELHASNQLEVYLTHLRDIFQVIVTDFPYCADLLSCTDTHEILVRQLAKVVKEQKISYICHKPTGHQDKIKIKCWNINNRRYLIPAVELLKLTQPDVLQIDFAREEEVPENELTKLMECAKTYYRGRLRLIFKNSLHSYIPVDNVISDLGGSRYVK